MASIDDEQLPSLNSFLGKSDPNILEVLAQHTATQPPNTSKAEERQKYNDRDIDQRQRLIDKLLEELDGRTEAVRKVGQELYRMREKNAQNEVYLFLSFVRLQHSHLMFLVDANLKSQKTTLRSRYSSFKDSQHH